MADNETTADIIAWLRRPREGENAYLTLWRDEIADRLEAAHKREVATTKESLAVGNIGDCAKLREALCDIVMLTMKVGHSIRGDVACGIIASKAKHALKQPPRNCDIGSAEEQWRRFCDIEAPTCRAEDVCHCRTAARCFADWSQRPYKEGGAK